MRLYHAVQLTWQVGEGEAAVARGLILYRFWQSNTGLVHLRVDTCVCECVCSDLHRALFDLVAARGVESRGLLEEELSGCLERLRGRNRDDQMFVSETFTIIKQQHARKSYKSFGVTPCTRTSVQFSNNTHPHGQTFFFSIRTIEKHQTALLLATLCTLSLRQAVRSDFLNLRRPPGTHAAFSLCVCVCVCLSPFVCVSTWLNSAHSKPTPTSKTPDHLLFPIFAPLPSPLFHTHFPPLLPRSLFRGRCKVGFPHPLRQKCVSISSCVSVAQCLCVSEWCKEPFALMCPGELWLTATHPPPRSSSLYSHYSPLSALQCCPFKPVTPSLSLHSALECCQFILPTPQPYSFHPQSVPNTPPHPHLHLYLY